MSVELGEFVVGILVPLMPLVLSLVESAKGYRDSVAARLAVAEGGEAILSVDDHGLVNQFLREAADRAYGWRARVGHVPTLYYLMRRAALDSAMEETAEELARLAR